MTLNDFFLLSLNLFLNHTCLEFPARKTSWAQGSTTESLSEPTGYTRSLRGPPRTVRFNRNLMCTWFSRDLQNSPSITSSTKQSKPLILSYLPCSDASKSKNDRDPKTTEITHLGIYDIYIMKYIFLWIIISAHSHYQMDIEFAEHLRKRVETPCMGVHPNNRIQLGQKGCGIKHTPVFVLSPQVQGDTLQFHLINSSFNMIQLCTLQTDTSKLCCR